MSNNFLKTLSFPCLGLYLISFLSFTQPKTDDLLKKEARSYLKKAYEYQKEGDIDNAITHYQKSVLLNPSYVSIYNELGILYEKKGMPIKAEEMYLKAIKEDPLYKSAHNNLAYLYESQGQVNKAVTHWKIRIKLSDKEDEWTRLVRERLDNYSTPKKYIDKDTKITKKATTKEPAKDKKKAAKITKSTRGMDDVPKLPSMKKKIKRKVPAELIDDGLDVPEPTEGKSELAKIKRETTFDSEFETVYPLVHADKERAAIGFAEDLIEEIKKAEKEPLEEIALRRMIKGDVYFKQENFEDALFEFKEAYSLNPSKEISGYIQRTENVFKARGHITKAEHFYNKGDYVKAVENFDKASALVPNNKILEQLAKRVQFELHMDNAVKYLSKKKYAPAVRSIDQAISLEPDNKDAVVLKEKISVSIKEKDL